MRLTPVLLAGAVLLPFAAGCKKTDDSKVNFTKAIDSYYSAKPTCLWADPVKFPVQADTSDTAKTAGYDALVDQGLLTRTTAEKKVFILGSKQVTNYDLSDKGRGAWTADPQQPGAGNFCFGSQHVTSIDSYTPTNDQPGATTTVNYHVGFTGAPAWASAPETQNAYPELRAELSGPVAGVATLTNTTQGWSVTSGPRRDSRRSTSTADGSIVQ